MLPSVVQNGRDTCVLVCSVSPLQSHLQLWSILLILDPLRLTQLTAVGNLAFTQPMYEVFVRENTAPVVLLTLHATTNTSDASVEYRLVSGAAGGLFVVGRRSGHLTLTAPLDYEAKNRYEIIVAGLAGEERAFVRVSVRAKDVNDLAPSFPRPVLETQITEEDDSHLPKLILQVSARDGDASDQGRLVYTLEGDGVSATHPSFSISRHSGHLHLLQALDRDAPRGRARWRLMVWVTDGPHTASAEVHVNVKDINDNAPFFPNMTINATVPENAEAGWEVTSVTATDFDDPREGTNAIISYSVEKNVIDEFSGQPIFDIDSVSGRVSTALCCLDRERTPFYAIQVVASDGGGLKGTGTVLVTVLDDNDVSPKFTRRDWHLLVHEITEPLATVAFLTVSDPDLSNEFEFRIIPESGFGWEKFRIVSSEHGSGALQAVQDLDYEDPGQRRGFKFRVQVSDKAANRWKDDEHVDEAWVTLTLVDDNDNAPFLPLTSVNLTLPEDTPVGYSLTTFTATDLDQGGEDEVRYTIDPLSDPFRLFAVDSSGHVWLRRTLDRESAKSHAVKVLAVDSGVPALTSTATLLLAVTDVNDNAPNVANPDTLYIPENSGPRHVADLLLDDADDWSKGHGPPFSVTLDQRAPDDIKKTFAVDFNAEGDEGRGVAVVTSLRPLDREESVTRLLPLVLGDARRLTTTATITLTVADVNDNPMRPGHKTVSVTRLMGEEMAIPLGRVYVDDKDDWDAGDKTWAWRRGEHHPLFTLHARTGQLMMSEHAHDGTYQLSFWVSDAHHGQKNVEANVTVVVKSVSLDDLVCAVPVTVTSHPPGRLITPLKGSGQAPLEALRAAVQSVAKAGVEVVSVEADSDIGGTSGTRLWLTALSRHPLDQILLLHRKKISTQSSVTVMWVGVNMCVAPFASKRHPHDRVWVVDANSTALVTPRLQVPRSQCNCFPQGSRLGRQQHKPVSLSGQPSVAAVTHIVSCHPNPCLNGGRCVLQARVSRCVCPEGTSGSICKQLSRHFIGNGWAWTAPLPSVNRAHISLEFLTLREEGLLLYAGPPDAPHLDAPLMQEDVLSVELEDGRPRLLLDVGSSPVLLAASPGHPLPRLADGHWHRLDVVWGAQRVELIVDRCEAGGECRVAAPLPPQEPVLSVAAPLQVGGLAHAAPDALQHGWPTQVNGHYFHGCIKNLRVNGELRDLGEAVLGEGSSSGCEGHDPCALAGGPCPPRARCMRMDGQWVCGCEPGWAGEDCHTHTQPAYFASSSYVKMALSSIPPAQSTFIQLRFRTWEAWGQLVAVTSQHGRDLAAIHLLNSHVCLQMRLHPAALTHLCLSEVPLADGEWHTVYVHRQGEWAELHVDEGDGPLYNATSTPAATQGWSTSLLVDRQEGVHVGGSPEYVGVSLYIVHHDFHDGCLDDLRVSGLQLPLPPLLNTSSLAQATMFTNVSAGCSAPSACANITCEEPFSCIDIWWRYECGCPVGSQISHGGGSCQDLDECEWLPCLNGGTCVNREPGYSCHCTASHGGEHCETERKDAAVMVFPVTTLVVVVVWSFLLLGLVVAVCICRLRRQHQGSSSGGRDALSAGGQGSDSNVTSMPAEQVELTVTTASAHPSPHPLRPKVTEEVNILRKSLAASHGEGQPGAGCGCPPLPTLDDLRNYAYEGDGSSPDSLSSCCSGGHFGGEIRFIGGFQEVSNLLSCLSTPETADPSARGGAARGSAGDISNSKHSSSQTLLHVLQSNLKAEEGKCDQTKNNGVRIGKTEKRDNSFDRNIVKHSSVGHYSPSVLGGSPFCTSIIQTGKHDSLRGKKEVFHQSLKRKKSDIKVTCVCTDSIDGPTGFSWQGKHLDQMAREQSPNRHFHSLCRTCIILSATYPSSVQGICRHSQSTSSLYSVLAAATQAGGEQVRAVRCGSAGSVLRCVHSHNHEGNQCSIKPYCRECSVKLLGMHKERTAETNIFQSNDT
ncbi:hypothetical protein O3P69_001675 [Scylla paramamosain]|uniref:Uncharacterized protein n=1 Tax=Scylla paramamosain TaxID=85552 RepID=A0AAW0UZW2_SCYPA